MLLLLLSIIISTWAVSVIIRFILIRKFRLAHRLLELEMMEEEVREGVLKEYANTRK